MEEIVKKLIKINKTISIMESCTGGYISNLITNIPNSSMIFKFGAVTYSNEYKIKMGVKKETIDNYTVYSMETAREMSEVISNYSNSDYGVGITGKLNKADNQNPTNLNNKVYISVYDRVNDKFIDKEVLVSYDDRCMNKEQVGNALIKILDKII